MTVPYDFDFEYRPASYWTTEGLLKSLLLSIKGEERRKMVQQALASGNESIINLVLQESLPEAARDTFAFADPALMGGEWLPDLLQGEVEIARVVFDSVMQDVYSVRAYCEGGLIHYRIIGEDEENEQFKVQPATSENPLTMLELIHLMDTCQRTGEDWAEEEFNTGIIQPYLRPDMASLGRRDYIEGYRDFFHVYSLFYPELEAYNAAYVNHWVDEQLRLLP